VVQEPSRSGVDANRLLAEQRLLERIRAAHSQGAFGRALSLSNQHAREFPEGVLTPERRGLELSSRCRSMPKGSPMPLEDLARFRRDYPRSSWIAALEARCTDH
jgi:hypothetical protein